MILCVDVGNTSTKMARVAGRDVHDFMTRPRDATAAQVARLLRRVARDGVDAAALASVRPEATVAMRAMIRREIGIDPVVITSRLRLPIQIATWHPARVGADRICAACGALGEGGRSAIVVDVGSAITVDLVLDRRFLGGLIMPGPQTMLSALHRFTAQLPRLVLGDARGDAFDDTVPAMRTGAVVGSAGAIEAAVRLLRARAGRPVPVRITGGAAAAILPRLPSRWQYEPHLTLRGLSIIARLNRG